MAEAGMGAGGGAPSGRDEGRPHEGASEPGIEHRLEAIVVRGRRALRSWAAKEALRKAASRLFLVSLIVPCLALAGNLVGLVATPVWPFGDVTTVVVAVLAPLAIMAAHALAIFLREKTDRRVCLTLYDQMLGFKGRLQAADEFLAAQSRGAFEQAAIEDAAPFARRALDAQLPDVRTPPSTLRPERWPLGVASVTILAIALLLGGLTRGGDASQAIVPDALVAQLSAGDEKPLDEETEPPRAKAVSRRSLDGQRLASLGESGPEAERERASRSDTGTGDARSSSASRNAAASLAREAGRAAAGASGEGTSRMNEPPERPAKPRRENTSRPEEPREAKPETSKGVAGGSGRSSGSRTSASDQPPADDKARNDESEGDATDDADDEEDEEQKSASTQRPMLNNRKAAVDRSLSPSGIGDQENPDANGRGGPGGLKKTRGVAAMLLGVPMPDHLRGKSNPGRVKVQRERADPEPKASVPDNAADRGSRGKSVGYLPHPQLASWMRDTIRDYFLAERRRDGSPEDDPTTTN